MQPYGKKPELRKGKVQGHNSDSCDICSNDEWKISKSAERTKTKVTLAKAIDEKTKEN